MGRPAHAPGVGQADNERVHESGFHRMDEYLSEEWLDGCVAEVIADVEAYLAKHAAFDAYLDEQDYADAA